MLPRRRFSVALLLLLLGCCAPWCSLPCATATAQDASQPVQVLLNPDGSVRVVPAGVAAASNGVSGMPAGVILPGLSSGAAVDVGLVPLWMVERDRKAAEAAAKTREQQEDEAAEKARHDEIEEQIAAVAEAKAKEQERITAAQQAEQSNRDEAQRVLDQQRHQREEDAAQQQAESQQQSQQEPQQSQQQQSQEHQQQEQGSQPESPETAEQRQQCEQREQEELLSKWRLEEEVQREEALLRQEQRNNEQSQSQHEQSQREEAQRQQEQTNNEQAQREEAQRQEQQQQEQQREEQQRLDEERQRDEEEVRRRDEIEAAAARAFAEQGLVKVEEGGSHVAAHDPAEALLISLERAGFFRELLQHNAWPFVQQGRPFAMLVLCRCPADDTIDLNALENLLVDAGMHHKFTFLWVRSPTRERFQVAHTYGLSDHKPAFVIDNIPIGQHIEK